MGSLDQIGAAMRAAFLVGAVEVLTIVVLAAGWLLDRASLGASQFAIRALPPLFSMRRSRKAIPLTAGPLTAGPLTAGPRTAGPRASGPRASGMIPSHDQVAALALVLASGSFVRGQLARVPENILTFVVGVNLSAFGIFWIGGGLDVPWAGDDLSILVFAGPRLGLMCVALPRRLILEIAP